LQNVPDVYSGEQQPTFQILSTVPDSTPLFSPAG